MIQLDPDTGQSLAVNQLLEGHDRGLPGAAVLAHPHVAAVGCYMSYKLRVGQDAISRTAGVLPAPMGASGKNPESERGLAAAVQIGTIFQCLGTCVNHDPPPFRLQFDQIPVISEWLMT